MSGAAAPAPAAGPPVIAVTTGEPAGIGPDIALSLALPGHAARLAGVARPVLLGDRAMLQARARALGLAPPPADAVIDIALGAPVVAGRLDSRNARYVLAVLDRAIDGCLGGEFDAIATAPVHKGVINDAGIAFSGHTEYLEARTGAPQVVMMLAGGGLRVALATTHLALVDVPRAITRGRIESVLRVLLAELRARFGIARPRVVVAGLNPHAGEGGHLGREEIDSIAPALAALRAEGADLVGPLPADTLFNPASLRGVDAVLAMFHDQGLPVLKYASFGRGVNITLGLPIVRTSVDHGTALDLAGSGSADASSLVEAIVVAAQMARGARAPGGGA